MEGDPMISFKELIESKGVSPWQLHKLSGVPLTSVVSVVRREREFKNITVENAIRIAAVLGMSVEEVHAQMYPTK